MRNYLGLCLGFICLWGCAQQPQAIIPAPKPQLPAIDTAFGQPAQIPQPEDFYRLSPQQQQHFLAFFHNPKQSHMQPNARIYAYVAEDLDNFSFQGANTLAQQTLENLSGNCMSLAVMVTALANLSGVDVGYRATYAEPMLDISDQTALSSGHVRSYLYNPTHEKDAQTQILRPSLGIDYFRGSLDRLGQKLQPHTFDAMVYNNLAVDALLAGDLKLSYWLSRAALGRDPEYKESMNLIAVIYRRTGDLVQSKQWFEIGLHYHPNYAALLSNYMVLAEQMEDLQLVQNLKQKLRYSEDENPYIWLNFANKAEQAQEYEDAIYFYRKLLGAAPYLHKANLTLAKLYLQKNDFDSAHKALTQALQYSYDADQKNRYQSKLKMLEQLAAK